MVTPSHRPLRARSQEEKQVRRGDILQAAERLWTSSPYAELSMNQVAREVQLAKGTLYLYFETREELFLALLESHYQRWAERATELLTEHGGASTPEQTAELLAQSFAESEGLRRLQLLSGQVLSMDASASALQFRQQQLKIMQRVAALLPFEADLALRVVQHSEALCLGWQYLAEKTPPAALLDKYPQLKPLQLNIDQQLVLALRAVICELARNG